jgi:peptidyl-prolyl cis-trans isomerase D
MALISTLREKMTKWVVGFIALAMIAFIVGSDLFGSGPRSIFGGSDKEIGVIAGNSISLEEYQAVLQDRENNYILNFGRQPGEREQPTLRQQAWDLLIAKYAITTQYEKVGVQVTTDEIWDVIQGKNIDENIKQSFLDSLGKFDRSKLISYLQSLDAQPANSEARVRWNLFKQSLVPGRERLKYENLIVKTNYVTEAEGERDYHNQNDVAEVKYLYVPFFSVSDSTIKVTDGDLKGYYEKNKKKYKVDLSRNMSYVTIPLVATAEDSLAIRQELERLKVSFATTTEDSAYATNNSDGKNAFEKVAPSKLPTFLASQKENLIAGTILGPLMDGSNYKLVKVVAVGEDTIGTAKASHILIKWDKDTPEEKAKAKEKATKILKEIKGGADFAAKAREFGTDGTASKGGDLGYFTSGQMVKPFEDAVFKAKKTGLLPELTETTFGYHIISVTEVKNNTAYTIATIEREITPSEATQNEAFRKADTFASGLSGVDAFKEKATKEGLIVYDANEVSTTERRVNNLGEARQMVTWLFRDAKNGKVSTVFDLENNYVVAVMTGETDAGFKPLEKIKDEITPMVKNELKGKAIIEKLAAQKGSLEEIAKAFGSDATVNTVNDLKLNGNALGTIGFDPTAVGAAFSLEGGKTTKPFAGENGVFIIEMKNKTVAPGMQEYATFKNQALQAMNGRVAYNVSEAFKDAAEIKDKRYKFY